VASERRGSIGDVSLVPIHELKTLSGVAGFVLRRGLNEYHLSSPDVAEAGSERVLQLIELDGLAGIVLVHEVGLLEKRNPVRDGLVAIPELLGVDVDDAGGMTVGEAVSLPVKDFASSADVADCRIDPRLAHAEAVEVGPPRLVHEPMSFIGGQVRTDVPLQSVTAFLVVAEVHDLRNASGVMRRPSMVLASRRRTNHQSEVGHEKRAKAALVAECNGKLVRLRFSHGHDVLRLSDVTKINGLTIAHISTLYITHTT
jgi:hypothetical protein